MSILVKMSRAAEAKLKGETAGQPLIGMPASPLECQGVQHLRFIELSSFSTIQPSLKNARATYQTYQMDTLQGKARMPKRLRLPYVMTLPAITFSFEGFCYFVCDECRPHLSRFPLPVLFTSRTPPYDDFMKNSLFGGCRDEPSSH